MIRPIDIRLGTRALGAVAAVVLALGLGACGSDTSDSPVQVTTLDTAKIESAIEDSILEQRGVHARVSCPVVQQKKGLGFACDAVVGSKTTKFSVTQLDDSGRVRYRAA